MFTQARIRLTAWYMAILATFLAILGSVIYLTVGRQIRNGVDSGVKLMAERARSDVVTGNQGDIDAVNQQGLYQITVLRRQGPPTVPPRARQHGLPNLQALMAAYRHGADLRTVRAPLGELRLYSSRVDAESGGVKETIAYVQVSRSTEPEREALDHLLTVLLVGGAVGLLLAAAGGWFLAGKSLAPVRLAFERQQAFVGDASHELRTPLAVIRANAEYLQAEHPDNTEIADIVGESYRLSGLVDSLLALARGDSTELDREHRPVDLAEVVQASTSSLQPLARDRGVTLAVRADEPVEVEGDADQLRQLLLILADNALRYTGPDGRVEIVVERRNGDALVTVTDTGIGIAEDDLERIFERFYRADAARNRANGGAGLGLAIARELVSLHGGTIGATSTPGEGSTFTVRLPARAA